MCSQWMENYQGDLTDIFRASGGRGGDRVDGGAEAEWGFPMNFLDNPDEDFGYPFTRFRDPLLLRGAEEETPEVSGFLQTPSFFKTGFEDGGCSNGGVGLPELNIFPILTQNSTAVAVDPPLLGDFPASQNESSSKSKKEGSETHISSPRNKGTKKRKNQTTKKVICIPAPLPSTTRSSGEVVPSDLWAWRKYGQKPIKGSPYPRAYYKCSTLKGCSARKQVERSRTDPNMLVITYSSEHNHPWPTHRNALAGSTRIPSSKKPSISPALNAAASSSFPAVKQEETGPKFFDSAALELDPDPFSFYDWNWNHNSPATTAATTGCGGSHHHPW